MPKENLNYQKVNGILRKINALSQEEVNYLADKLFHWGRFPGFAYDDGKSKILKS